MFFEIYEKLCQQNGLSANAVAKKLHISSGSVTEWKKGRTPQNATLKKISNYFNVSIDYLLGKTENKKTATHLEQQTTFSFEGIESENPLINNSNFEQINELTTISRNLSPEQISLLIAMAKNMQNK